MRDGKRTAGRSWFFPHRHKTWQILIPRIGVGASVVALNLPRDTNLLPVPPLSEAWQVGWYRFSARPGRRGSAVFVGHVDTYRGPAVFYNLYQLRRGDHIYIDTSAHNEVRYTVHWVRELSKSHFPARQIFGHTRARRLWLITCGGAFDYATRSYVDNIIVSAGK